VEKLVDRHIRDSVLKEYPPHSNQHVYRTRKYTETTFHNLVTCMKSAFEYKKIAIGAFLDIEGDLTEPHLV
jgi:hypothetical protein